MEEINQLREEQKLQEIRQNNLLLNFVKQERKSFEFANVSQQLAYEKNLEDATIINDALTNWSGKIKPDDSRKKEVDGLLFSLWRMMAYSQNLETITKTAVSKYISIEKRNTELVSENKLISLKSEAEINKLKKEIDALKKENEFLSKS